MKISKSKQELARVISENGGWRDGAESSAQCSDGSISFWHDKATKKRGEEWCGDYLGACDDIKFTGVKLPDWHQTILSREEYFYLYQAPDADGWIEWNGGECPVGEDDRIDVKFSDGDTLFDVDSVWDWGYNVGACYIIAYRLRKPEQAKPATEPVVVAKPTIEQLATDYRNRMDFAYRKQQEADGAKVDAEEALRKLELAGEAIGLIVTPIAAKKEPELVITDWRDLRNGDIVVITGSDSTGWKSLENKELEVRVCGDSCDDIYFGRWCMRDNTYWRFIRRP